MLEGIALVGDPEFKLIMESFPFVSKLVMTDRSPALRVALKQILYKDGSFSPTRLRVLLDSSQGIINEGEAFVDFDTPSTDSAVTKEAIEFLFSDDGAVIKDILVEEIAKGIDVIARDAYSRVALSFERSVPAPVRGFLSREYMLPLVPIPFTFGPSNFFALPPVNDDERAYIENMRELIEWLTNEDLGGNRISRQAMRELLPEIIAKSQVIGRQVAGRLGETFLRRLFDDLIRGNGEEVAGKRRVSLR